jgi:hypothetical protein
VLRLNGGVDLLDEGIMGRIEFIWVFNGARSSFPGGIFTD